MEPVKFVKRLWISLVVVTVVELVMALVWQQLLPWAMIALVNLLFAALAGSAVGLWLRKSAFDLDKNPYPLKYLALVLFFAGAVNLLLSFVFSLGDRQLELWHWVILVRFVYDLGLIALAGPMMLILAIFDRREEDAPAKPQKEDA